LWWRRATHRWRAPGARPARILELGRTRNWEMSGHRPSRVGEDNRKAGAISGEKRAGFFPSCATNLSERNSPHRMRAGRKANGEGRAVSSWVEPVLRSRQPNRGQCSPNDLDALQDWRVVSGRALPGGRLQGEDASSSWFLEGCWLGKYRGRNLRLRGRKKSRGLNRSSRRRVGGLGAWAVSRERRSARTRRFV
jgi:hypothetical protein